MRILIVTQVFSPENFIVNNLSNFLVDSNHSVTIITGKPNYPSGEFYTGHGFFSKIKGDYNGATVYRLPIIPRGVGSNVSLMLNYISFVVVGSVFSFFFRKKFDFSFVFAVSPITSALPALVHKLLYGTKMYLWVLDLWPESVMIGNRIKSPLILRCLKVIVALIYRSSDRIYMSSSYMRTSIIKYQRKQEKFDIRHFPNWIKDFSPSYSKHKYNSLIPEGFNVMLAGNIGVSIDYPSIIMAAHELSKFVDIKFLILGSGSKEKAFKKDVKKQGLEKKIIFLGRHPVEAMPSFYIHADLMLLTLSDNEAYSYTVPEKLQSYMAMKKPIVGMVNGESGRIIKDSESGLSVNSGDYISLAKNIIRLYNMPESELESLGQNGYEYAHRNFNLSKNIRIILN